MIANTECQSAYDNNGSGVLSHTRGNRGNKEKAAAYDTHRSQLQLPATSTASQAHGLLRLVSFRRLVPSSGRRAGRVSGTHGAR